MSNPKDNDPGPEDAPEEVSSSGESSQKDSSDENPSKNEPLPELPPIPEEAKAVPADEEALELVPVLEEDAPVPKRTPGFTIIGGDGDEYGPKPIEDIARWIRTGRANARTLVRASADAPWQPLGEVPQLAALLEGGELPPKRPGRLTAILWLTLGGGLAALAWTVFTVIAFFTSFVPSFGLACCLIPGGIYSFISGIIITVQGIRLLGRNADRLWARTGTSATLQICNVFALNPICVICGIVTHVLLRNDEVMNYIQNTDPNAGQKK